MDEDDKYTTTLIDIVQQHQSLDTPAEPTLHVLYWREIASKGII